MTMQPPPIPRVDETTDVLVEQFSITVIRALSATQTVTAHAVVWTTWVGSDKRGTFDTRDEACAAALNLAEEVGRPAWVREDANHPWQVIE